MELCRVHWPTCESRQLQKQGEASNVTEGARNALNSSYRGHIRGGGRHWEVPRSALAIRCLKAEVLVCLLLPHSGALPALPANKSRRPHNTQTRPLSPRPVTAGLPHVAGAHVCRVLQPASSSPAYTSTSVCSASSAPSFRAGRRRKSWPVFCLPFSEHCPLSPRTNLAIHTTGTPAPVTYSCSRRRSSRRRRSGVPFAPCQFVRVPALCAYFHLEDGDTVHITE